MSGSTTGILPGYVAAGAPDDNPDARVLHHNNLDALIWLQTSAEAHACYVQTFALARLRVEQALASPPPEGTRWCVFSDLDETLLDNSAYNEWLVAAGHNFEERGSWDAYVREAISTATPGSVEFATWLDAQRDANGAAVALVYVTSRLDSVREATARNLAALGLPLPDGSADPARTHLFMKDMPIAGRPSDKYVQYAHVRETRGLTPILWLGDNAADFDPRFRLGANATDVGARLAVAVAENARWGVDWLQFPNPVYGGFLQYLRVGNRTALADDRNAVVPNGGPARLPRTADGIGSQGRVTPKMRALAPWPRAAVGGSVGAPPRQEGRMRFAAYNVENLFTRARALNKDDETASDRVLGAIGELQRLLEQPAYDRPRILKVFNDNELYAFVTVRSDRINVEDARSPRFFFHRDSGSDFSPAESINTAIRGRADWSGSIQFRRDEFSGPQVDALARVILGLDADVLVLSEVEDRRALEAFNVQALENRYKFVVLFDGNDERGIDVAVLSKLPVGCMRTNAFTLDPAGGTRADGTPERLFSRDCLEVEVILPGGGGTVAFLCNHLKSKSGGPRGERETDPKRIRQSTEIARILRERYAAADGAPRRVIVAGDLNEIPDRNGANGVNLGGAETSIDALLVGSGLRNVHRERLGGDAWTYPFEQSGRVLLQQIDYLLASPDIAAAVRELGVERSGQPGAGPGSPREGEAASDHAALWMDVDPAALV